MTGEQPLVSIGLPVYNGGAYLEESIRSLLGQTYKNIELIICDNLSTDGTHEVCERAARLDDRVRYHRNSDNIGGAKNHNLTFEMARGKYFRWAAHDDIAEPELIERCVQLLETEPDVVVCHTDFVHIDEHGESGQHVSRNHCGSTRASERFLRMSRARDFCEETYGVIRSEVFGRTCLQQNYTGSDRTLMSELALYGRFANIDECLFKKRVHPANEYVDWRTRMAWFGDKYKGRIVHPWWTQLADYVAVVRRVPLRSSDRSRCSLHMAGWTVINSPKLAKDLFVAASQIVRSRQSRLRRFRATENWG